MDDDEWLQHRHELLTYPQFNQMMGFTEEEVREMLTYYSTNSPFRHTVDELIEIMKPWYDNYCFAQDCYGETTMYNSNMVLYFVKNYIDNGKAPREMIEDNIRIDYEKLRMLIRKDKGVCTRCFRHSDISGVKAISPVN